MKINKKIANNTCYPNRNNPKYIVIHETDNWSQGAGAERHATALYNGNLRGSAHYYVDDKEIWQTLDHAHGAWAVGDGKGKHGITNLNSINVEICVNPDSNYDVARSKAIKLTKQLMQSTGISIDRVVRHHDASGKRCPRHMVDDPALWADFKSQLGGEVAESHAPAMKPQNEKTWHNYINGQIVKDLQYELNRQFSAGLAVDGWFGDNTIAALVNVRRGARGGLTRIIQKRLITLGYSFAYGADGVFGSATDRAVCNFQRANGLTVDGIVGKKTWMALFRK